MLHGLDNFLQPSVAAQDFTFQVERDQVVGVASKALVGRFQRFILAVEIEESQPFVGPCAGVTAVEFEGAFRITQGFGVMPLQELLTAAIEPCQGQVGIEQQGLVVGDGSLGETLEFL